VAVHTVVNITNLAKEEKTIPIKCNACNKTFPYPASLTTETVPTMMANTFATEKVTRILFEQKVCQFCKSPDLTEVKQNE